MTSAPWRLGQNFIKFLLHCLLLPALSCWASTNFLFQSSARVAGFFTEVKNKQLHAREILVRSKDRQVVLNWSATFHRIS